MVTGDLNEGGETDWVLPHQTSVYQGRLLRKGVYRCEESTQLHPH